MTSLDLRNTVQKFINTADIRLLKNDKGLSKKLSK